MISSETRELLDGFEQRMRFVNIVKYWVDRVKSSNIRDRLQISDDKVDNLVLMVLLFIMDSTLRYGERCTKENIVSFVRELSEIYGFAAESAEDITEYIVVELLQNKGKLRSFETYQSDGQCFEEQNSIIVTETKSGSYTLTNEAYEFLFRTKEIDSELAFAVTRFKLQEQFRRRNYAEALNASRELVSRVRGLKTRMDDFMLRCKTNIASVTVDEYEEIIKQVKNSFEDESKQLEDIRRQVNAELQAAIAEFSFDDNSDVKQAERSIKEILANVDTVINEQSRVYNSKFTLSEIYTRLSDEKFSRFRSEYFDFEQELLMPMQRMQLVDANNIGKLFQTLYKPTFPHLFSLYFFYDKQKEIKNASVDKGLDIGVSDDTESIEDIRNKRYTEIIEAFFSYANKHDSFSVGEYIESLPKDSLAKQMSKNLLPEVILRLYSSGEIDLKQWKPQQGLIVPAGNFDLAYCLNNIPRELIQMSKIVIQRKVETITFSDGENNRITMSDFTVEVIE